MRFKKKNYLGCLLKFFFLCCSGFSISYALNREGWQQATLKVNSYPCVTQSPRFQGSGLIFYAQQEYYILTSEHVLIHSFSKDICHEASQQKLSLQAVDFYYGLALLKFQNQKNLTEDFKKRAIPLAILKPLVPDTTSVIFSALGYPFNSESLVERQNGKLLTRQSERALIPGIPFMTEITELPVEYGMSGGLLISQGLKGEWNYEGMISHQYLKREQGRPTKNEEIKESLISIMDAPSATDISLFIPSPFIYDWLLANLKKQTQERSPIYPWYRHAEAQIQRYQVLQYGPLLFMVKVKKSKDVWEIGGSDGSGVGGGGHGVASSLSTEETVPLLEVTLNEQATPEQKREVLTNPYLERWKQILLQGKKIFVISLLSLETKKSLPIESLSQFLTLWLKYNYKPIVIQSVDPTHPGEVSQMMIRVRQVIKQVELLRSLTESMVLKNWLMQIRETALAAENLFVTSAELQELLQGPHDPYWKQLYSTHFDETVLLERSILDLIDQMKKEGAGSWSLHR